MLTYPVVASYVGNLSPSPFVDPESITSSTSILDFAYGPQNDRYFLPAHSATQSASILLVESAP